MPHCACFFFPFFLTRIWSQTLYNCSVESTIAVLSKFGLYYFSFMLFLRLLATSVLNPVVATSHFPVFTPDSHDVQPYRCPGLRSFRKFAGGLAILVGDVGLGGRNRRRGGSSSRREGVVLGHRRPRAPANACYRGETMRRVLNMEFVPC